MMFATYGVSLSDQEIFRHVEDLNITSKMVGKIALKDATLQKNCKKYIFRFF